MPGKTHSPFKKPLWCRTMPILVWVLAILLLSPLAGQEKPAKPGEVSPAVGQEKSAKIDAVMERYHRENYFNGSVLVAESGKVIYKKAFGCANREWDIPNTIDTKYRLGSITKQFTAMLIFQLIQEGKIGLDSKLSQYLPEYRRDTGDKVTIRQMMNHTSGIPDYAMANGQ